jgi:hypothetical protein
VKDEWKGQFLGQRYRLSKLRSLLSFSVTYDVTTFGPKRDEVTGEWRKLHNEELSDLYSLPNIVRVVKSKKMRWAEACIAYGGRESCAEGSGGET